MHKVQLTLTPEEVQALHTKASRLGYGITKYIKFLISKEVVEVVGDYPVIQLSKKAIKTIEQAHRDHKAGKTILLENVDDLDRL
ncbi:MAG: hypothetical protein AAB874_01175 [Patescibacteria group bacterium]